MKYEIWLGNTGLYGVESVEESAERKIAVYDSVGTGKFPQAESRGLREWQIKCELTEHNDRHLKNWSEASDIFKSLHSLLDKKTPARLVIRSDCGRTSERVLLKNFTKEEVVSGVYSVELSCIEYVDATVKSTDVPFVARPGKMPELPTTVTISYKGDGSGMTPYELAELAKQNDVDAQWICNEAIVTNPATLKEGDVVTPALSREGGRGWFTDADKLEKVDLSAAGKEIYEGLKKLDQGLFDATIGKGVAMAQKAMSDAMAKYEEADKEWKYR